MTISEFAMVERESRDHKHNKRKHRHVDQIKRLERVAYKAKRHGPINEDDGADY